MQGDDGWKSRKLAMAVLAMLLVLLGFILTGCPESLYGDYCTAVIAAAFGFKAANVLEGMKRKPPDPPPT